MIHTTSLSQTIDNINAAHFEGRALAATERRQVARWIAARQGLPGAYGGTFAAFPAERSNGVVLFTGERVYARRRQELAVRVLNRLYAAARICSKQEKPEKREQYKVEFVTRGGCIRRWALVFPPPLNGAAARRHD